MALKISRAVPTLGHVLLLFSIVALQADALIVQKKRIISERFVTTFDQFSMESATVTLDASVGVASPSYVYADTALKGLVKIMICPERRYASVVSDANSVQWACWVPGNGTGPSIPDCITFQVDGSRQQISVPHRALYRFVVVNCLRDTETSNTAMVPVVLTANYTVINADGSQLSIGSKRMPEIYAGLMILWSVIVVGWAAVTAWQWRLRNSIHRALWVVMILKTAVCVVTFVYWRVFANTGVRVDGLNHARSVLFASSEAIMFAVFMLIAKGWLITRHTMPSGEIRSSALALVLLLGSLLFLSFYSDEYYYMAMLIMYFFMLPKVFTAITRNSRLLQSELFVLEQIDDRRRRNAEVAEMHRHVNDKYLLFSRLRRLVGAYLVALLVVNSVRLVSVWEFDWTLSLLNEMNAVIVVVGVSYLCRPQRSGVFAVLANRNRLHFEWRRVLADAGLVIGDADYMNAINNMPLVEPWDVTKSFIVEWPSSDGKDMSLALAVEENYDRENEESSQ